MKRLLLSALILFGMAVSPMFVAETVEARVPDHAAAHDKDLPSDDHGRGVGHDEGEGRPDHSFK